MKLSLRLWVSSSVELEVAIELFRSGQLEHQVVEVPLEGMQGEVCGYDEIWRLRSDLERNQALRYQYSFRSC